MPNTRKKVIKTVYKDDNDSEADSAAGDFSDSGSEAEIPDHSSSEEDVPSDGDTSSSAELIKRPFKKFKKATSQIIRRPKITKDLMNKLKKRMTVGEEEVDVTPALFSVNDLTDADKTLPSFLNLSESDSSEDESSKSTQKKQYNIPVAINADQNKVSDDEGDINMEYKDVWSHNVQDNSEEVARKTFMELEQHKTHIENTKAAILSYTAKTNSERGSDVKDLLALGEEVLPEATPIKKGRKKKKTRDDSDSEMEDWEEVNEAKPIPQQGLQLIVDIPDAVCRKSKKIDVEMMMKRKINRVKKENQVYMHKVHVLCWLAHGNYVSRVLNDQEILAAVLSLVPSKECYPGERVDMKYVEQITMWYKDKLTLNQDKNEDKFRPKAPPLKEILLRQIQSRAVTTNKYLVFLFVSLLRALGLQCRVMFNFVTLPLKPPTSELCSLSTKSKDETAAQKSNKNKKDENDEQKEDKGKNKARSSKCKSKRKMTQVDGNFDMSFSSNTDSDTGNIMQVDGNDDALLVKGRRTRTTANKKNVKPPSEVEEDVSPPKMARKSSSPRPSKSNTKTIENKQSPKSIKNKQDVEVPQKRKTAVRKQPDGNVSEVENSAGDISDLKKTETQSTTSGRRRKVANKSALQSQKIEINNSNEGLAKSASPRKTSNTKKSNSTVSSQETKTDDNVNHTNQKQPQPPTIVVTNDKNKSGVSSIYFEVEKSTNAKKLSLTRNRVNTSNPGTTQETDKLDIKGDDKTKSRTKSAPGSSVEKSKYFNGTPEQALNEIKKSVEDKQRVSYIDLIAKAKTRSDKNDIASDIINIIKTRLKEAKEDSKKGIVKGKIKIESDEDSDYLPEEVKKQRNSDSENDFKPVKISPKPSTSRKIDRRVLSSDSDTPKNKYNIWCEVFVEELEQWIAVDVIKGKVHCPNEIYGRATHPVCYVVGWDNNNYLKDLTRRYVPHWNTVTRKQRAEQAWWEKAIQPWTGPKTARDKEEDEQLNRMQLEAPLPKSIAEYKNHPLYALKRHLLKFEAIYPPYAAILGFVRGEAVYARECVYVCRSRDTWLKEAKVVRLAEEPYKVVKARPKWDKLSNKLIKDKPLEVFGPWQVQDYEPPVAENGIVPRNAYGNVELFKECMLPKGTVHIKLPGLNKVANKLNIDCAPAMTGFDFNGGWSHPVYDGFVVCQEFGEIITEAWLLDQEEQERKEQNKMEQRVYGNWKRLIKGLLIRERLKNMYGFENPTTSQDKKSAKAPRLVVKKR